MEMYSQESEGVPEARNRKIERNVRARAQKEENTKENGDRGRDAEDIIRG